MECPECGVMVKDKEAIILLRNSRDILDPIFPGCEEVKTIEKYLKTQRKRKNEERSVKMGIHHRQAQALESIAQEMRHIRRLFQKMTGETIEEENCKPEICGICNRRLENNDPLDQYVTFHPDNTMVVGGYYTDSRFWDCNCQENYIHSATEDKCLICGTKRKGQPISRMDEIITMMIG